MKEGQTTQWSNVKGQTTSYKTYKYGLLI